MITLETKLLNQVLDVNAKNLGSGKIIPMFETVLFKIEKGVCNITTSDGISETTTFMKINDESINENFAVDGSAFVNTIKLIDDEFVDLIIKGSALTIKAGKSKFKMSTFPGKDFPVIPFKSDIEFIKIPTDSVSRIIKAGSCVNPNDTRISMSGINMYTEKGKLIIQGTDAFIFYRSTSEVEQGEIESVVINKVITSVIENFKNATELYFATDNKTAVFKSSSAIIKVKLVDASQKYPQEAANKFVEKLGKQGSFTIHRMALIKAIKRAMIYSKIDTKGILISCNDEEKVITVTSESRETHRSSSEELVYKSFELGQDASVGVNSSFMLSMLNNIESEYVRVQVAGLREPVFITDPDGLSDETTVIAPFNIGE